MDKVVIILLCDNSVLQDVTDKFGHDAAIKMRKNNRQFIAKVELCPTPEFFAWVFQMKGRVRIEEPDSALQSYTEMINKAFETTTTELSRVTEALLQELMTVRDGNEITTSQLLIKCGYDPDEFDHEDLNKYHEALLHAVEASCQETASKLLSLVRVQPADTNGVLPWHLSFYAFNDKTRATCPICGNKNTARILYGKRWISDELQEKIDTGKIQLGGCLRNAVISGDGTVINTDPTRYCNDCKKEFGRPALRQDKEHVVPYVDMVKSVKYRYYRSHDFVKRIEIEKNSEGALVSVNISDDWACEFGSAKQQIALSEWQKLLDTLYNKFDIHEWKKKYTSAEDDYDGWGWELEVTLDDEQKQTYSGSNKEPPYYDELKNLLWPYEDAVCLQKYVETDDEWTSEDAE